MPDQSGPDWKRFWAVLGSLFSSTALIGLVVVLLLWSSREIVDETVTAQDSTTVTKSLGVGVITISWLIGLAVAGSTLWSLLRTTLPPRRMPVPEPVDEAAPPASRTEGRFTRQWLAATTIALTVLGIAALAIVIVAQDPSNGLTVFNVLVPVFASWVGTVLAFYFGRESFETANQQVRDLVTTVTELSPEQRESVRAGAIMRPVSATTYLKLDSGADETSVTLADMSELLKGETTRLPIVDHELRPLYMIHKSEIDRYRVESGMYSLADTLADFLGHASNSGRFGPNAGFATLRPAATLRTVKESLDGAKLQDVFLTSDGSSQSPLEGWISNTRLSRFLPSA